MRKVICLSILIALTTQFSFAKNFNLQTEINQLNQYIKKQDIYKNQKEERIAFIKSGLQSSNLSLEERYSKDLLLYQEFSTYNYDSMYVYAEKMHSLAVKMHNKNFEVRAQLAIANTFMWGGLFKEASEYFVTIDTIGINKQNQVEYWSTLFDISYESGLYARYNKILFPIYKDQLELIIQQLEKIVPEDQELILMKKHQLAFHNEEYAKALQYGLKLKDLTIHKDSITSFHSELLGGIGYDYIGLGDTIQAMQYMTQSAILGIKLGSCRYSAMRKIAEVTYGAGYLEDAYKYIQLSMSNAKSFGSRYRIYEASKILPKVDSDLNSMLQQQKKEILYLLILISICSCLMLISIILFVKRNKKLNLIREQLRNQNIQLTESNKTINIIIDELSESNKIKEAGIAQLFNLNIEFYDKMEVLQKGILRKIKTKQINDLEDFVLNSDLFETRNEVVKSFDVLFLQLFPNFVESFNSLLQPSYHIIVPEKDQLTPELRIFALIRIGFTKNETIAKLLNYSVSTIKNYKTKIKNNSIFPNDEFEERLKECS